MASKKKIVPGATLIEFTNDTIKRSGVDDKHLFTAYFVVQKGVMKLIEDVDESNIKTINDWYAEKTPIVKAKIDTIISKIKEEISAKEKKIGDVRDETSKLKSEIEEAKIELTKATEHLSEQMNAKILAESSLKSISNLGNTEAMAKAKAESIKASNEQSDAQTKFDNLKDKTARQHNIQIKQLDKQYESLNKELDKLKATLILIETVPESQLASQIRLQELAEIMIPAPRGCGLSGCNISGGKLKRTRRKSKRTKTRKRRR